MTLSLHTLKPAAGSHHRRKRLGRGLGSGHGAYSTRGVKGQRARQGGRKGLIQLGAKHFVTRLPKVRGFRSFKVRPQIVTLVQLGRFEAATKVTPEQLYKVGLIADRSVPVKIVGHGTVKKLQVSVHAITAGARAAIEKAGGTVEAYSAPVPANKKVKA